MGLERGHEPAPVRDAAKAYMIRREEGFTLVELMITMIIFTLVIAAASNIFSNLLNQFKQQTKIAETNIEGIISLDMMRVDLQQAGFGVPWNVEINGDDSGDDDWNSLAANYSEAVSDEGGGADPLDKSYYNDGDPESTIPAGGQRAPRGLVAENDAGPEMGTGANTWRSDYLAVKATSIGLNAAAQKWTHITNSGETNLDPRIWNDSNEDLQDAVDRIIVERPAMGPGGSQQRVLITNSGTAPPSFSVIYQNTAADFPAAFQPGLDTLDAHFIYGVAPVNPASLNQPLRAPFNRADFYVSRPPANMPSHCAPNTGILYKAVMNHSDGEFQTLPLLDCVADMQVVFISVDPVNPNTLLWNDADFTTGLSAQDIRNRVRGVVVYILAHEGQMDRNFTFNNFSDCNNDGTVDANCILVGDFFGTIPALYGSTFNLLNRIGADFANYRWKVYTISVKLPNLR